MKKNHMPLWVRLMALMLVAIMAFGVLTACNGDNTQESDTESDSASGSESSSESESESSSESESESESESTPTEPTYTVTVVDDQNAPQAAVKVLVFATEGDDALYTGQTDDKGVYTFSAPTAAYKVAVQSETHQSAEATVAFAEGETALTVTVTALPAAATAFTVSNVFSDNMVVQRGEYVRVWGWADESQNGKRVSGKFLGTVAHTVIENGEWVLTFEEKWVANTSMGNTMTIYGEGVEHSFNDVLVGDVYMAIGQSNIDYNMQTHIANAASDEKGTLDENALIRLHYNGQDQTAGYPVQGSDEVCQEIRSNSRWELPTKANYLRFSAIGYLFAEKMLKANGNTVPVGVIEVQASGMHLAGFLSNEVAEATKADTYNASKGIYEANGVNGLAGSRYVYNRYIYPFEKYAISGIIWYQGESDLHDENTEVYAERFVPLMEQMRETHNVIDKDFPIYMIELARCYDANWKFGTVRAVQGYIAAQCLTNAYLIPASDFLPRSPRDTLHPDNKWAITNRLAAVAAAVEYGQGTLDASLGPVLISVELSENGKTAVLTYANVGEGLKTSDGSENVKGFVAISSNFISQFNLRATITAPNQITLTSVRALKGIGYNVLVTNGFSATKNDTLNLCNSEGVPAGATIIFPEET